MTDALKTLLIGIGNPLRGDDGVGWRVAADLAEAAPSDDVEVLCCHQLTPELAETLSRVDRAFFIDADVGLAPGEVRCTPLAPAPSTEPLSHRLEPAALLGLAGALYGRCPAAHLVAIGPESLDAGEGLSATVERALAAGVRLLYFYIARGRWQGETPEWV